MHLVQDDLSWEFIILARELMAQAHFTLSNFSLTLSMTGETGKRTVEMGVTTYANLLMEAQPRVIHDEKAHKRALRWIDQFMKMEKLSAAQETLLELLSKLVNDYEEQIYPTPNLPPRDILQHLLENSGKSQAEFSRTIGLPRSTVSEVLTGKRKLSVENAFRLAEYFHVEPTLFLER